MILNALKKTELSNNYAYDSNFSFVSSLNFAELISSPSCDVDDNDADESGVNRSMMLPTVKEINVPALGKYWRIICSIRLQIQKSKDTPTTATAMASTSTAAAIIKKSNERTIRILKSNQHPANGCCVVHINDTGIE